MSNEAAVEAYRSGWMDGAGFRPYQAPRNCDGSYERGWADGCKAFTAAMGAARRQGILAEEEHNAQRS